MKKILGLLFISASMFSMELAYKLQTPRFIKSQIAKVHTIASDIKSEAAPIVHNTIKLNIPKFKINSSSIRAPHYLGDVQLYHGKKGFIVVQDGERQLIEKVLMNETASEITKKNLKSFLKSGFLKLNQTNDGKFTLEAYHRLNGGGPIFGKIMYWATKITCYAVLTAAAGAIVIGGGSVGVGVVKGAKGAKLAVTTAKAAKAAHAATTAASNFKVATVMVQGTTGYLIGEAGAAATITQASGAAIFTANVVNRSMGAAGVIGAGIATAGGAPTCAKVVGAGLATGTSSTGIVAGIEAISLTVGLACGLTPTP